MSVINYFSIVVPDKAGEGVKVLDALKAAGINLLSVWAYPIKGKKSVVEIAPEDAKLFAKTAKKLKLECSAKKTAFLIEGEDQLGAVAGVLGKLACAGISVRAAQAVAAGGGRYGMMVEVADDDVKKAKKALK